VTGLRPESHGIVSNCFFDPKYNETFLVTSSTTSQSKWWGGEPVRTANEDNIYLFFSFIKVLEHCRKGRAQVGLLLLARVGRPHPKHEADVLH